MSDVSKTNELIAEADDHQAADLTDPDGDYCRNCADAWPCVTRRLADALEAATRVPVQGEPNDELIEYALDYIENGTMRPGRREALRALASRATVPDAATEELLRIARRDASRFEDEAVGAIAERDAALAAVARVREIHAPDSVVSDACSECSDFGTDEHPVWLGVPWPCPTVAALDGAPEPEVKP